MSNLINLLDHLDSAERVLNKYKNRTSFATDKEKLENESNVARYSKYVAKLERAIKKEQKVKA